MRAYYLFRVIILFCFGSAFTLFSCSKDPLPQDYVNITDQYEVRLHQHLSLQGGLPSLQISSIELQDCINSYIAHQTIVSADKLQLFLNDILTEGECISGSEIVSEEVMINIANPELSIEINLKDVIKNSGILYTNNHEFDLELSKFDGLKITKTRLNRILPGMIWGSYSLPDEDIVQNLDAFINDSNDNLSKVKGDYGHFYVAQDYSTVIYKNENTENTTFLISYADDFENFEAKILEFKDLADGLVFQATNYDGKSLIIE